jgi:hypothetical protein
VQGKVLDVTAFLDEHPGGKKVWNPCTRRAGPRHACLPVAFVCSLAISAQTLLRVAGQDATKEFLSLHKPDVLQKCAAPWRAPRQYRTHMRTRAQVHDEAVQGRPCHCQEGRCGERW